VDGTSPPLFKYDSSLYNKQLVEIWRVGYSLEEFRSGEKVLLVLFYGCDRIIFVASTGDDGKIA